MQLHCFKSLWGLQESYEQVARKAREFGFYGLEGPAPKDKQLKNEFVTALEKNKLQYIAEIATTDSFVPNRKLNINDHLKSLQQHIINLEDMPVRFITCLGGCDAWPLEDSLAFFSQAIRLAEQAGFTISFETHRGRSLFNPWGAKEIAEQLPDIKLTFDISHWAVVCEGLQETEEQLIEELAVHAHHIHARVGYDQGPQVPDPRFGVYKLDLQQHLKLWQSIWQVQKQQGIKVTTVTPEFGPDGYEYRDKEGGKTLVNLDDINNYMMHTLRTKYSDTFPEQLLRA